MTAKKRLMNGTRKRNKACGVLLIIISLSLVGMVQAEQKTIQYLTTEPLTLFDLGMYKLDKLINEDPSLSATITFDWKNNKININVVILEWMARKGVVRNSQNKREAYELISTMVNKIRTKLGFDYQTGKIVSGKTALEDCFRPAGERTLKNEPKHLKNDLFNMTDILVRFSGENLNMTGKAPLKGAEIYFDEE